ncbi:MAG: hypothetical protein IPJ33_00660 [Gammaproteobacteria bacterium]|nr:hypothetical protein [Gammaproteobacteria bacterium]MBK7167791.1 hypothetical protein [Gammaproteobacteria bacterium]MBK7518652.1 hypothetical protein [Gammaproteobacteria bacterium]MBK7727044.1 hypothetical protein [Gammaproteobacteria bacterium]
MAILAPLLVYNFLEIIHARVVTRQQRRSWCRVVGRVMHLISESGERTDGESAADQASTQKGRRSEPKEVGGAVCRIDAAQINSKGIQTCCVGTRTWRAVAKKGGA